MLKIERGMIAPISPNGRPDLKVIFKTPHFGKTHLLRDTTQATMTTISMISSSAPAPPAA